MEVLPHSKVISLWLVYEHLCHAELRLGGISRPEHRRLGDSGVEMVEEGEDFPERKSDAGSLEFSLEEGRVDSLSQEKVYRWLCILLINIDHIEFLGVFWRALCCLNLSCELIF